MKEAHLLTLKPQRRGRSLRGDRPGSWPTGAIFFSWGCRLHAPASWCHLPALCLSENQKAFYFLFIFGFTIFMCPHPRAPVSSRWELLCGWCLVLTFDGPVFVVAVQGTPLDPLALGRGCVPWSHRTVIIRDSSRPATNPWTLTDSRTPHPWPQTLLPVKEAYSRVWEP